MLDSRNFRLVWGAVLLALDLVFVGWWASADLHGLEFAVPAFFTLVFSVIPLSLLYDAFHVDTARLVLKTPRPRVGQPVEGHLLLLKGGGPRRVYDLTLVCTLDHPNTPG